MGIQLESVLASSLVFIVFAIAIFGIMFIFNSRGLKKSREYYKTLHEGLKPGKEVMLNNGIYGKLVSVKENFIELEISKGVVIKADRFSVKEIV